MRLVFTFLFLILFSMSNAQNDEWEKEILLQEELLKCELLTLKMAEQVADAFIQDKLDSIETILNEWIKSYGLSEFTQRVLIIKSIKEGKSSAMAIQTYYENEFQRYYQWRLKDAKASNYQSIYNEDKAFYFLVPLRHRVDSILAKTSQKLLNFDTLNPDEQFICLLFSGEVKAYQKAISTYPSNNSFIKEYHTNELKNNTNCIASLGLYSPILGTGVFGPSPTFGVSWTSPLKSKFVFGLGFKLGLHFKRNAFDIHEHGDTNRVNPVGRLFLGMTAGFKLLDKPNCLLIPNIGLGFDLIETERAESNSSQTDQTQNETLFTLNYSLGISAMKPISYKYYLGIGLNYHYCPFQPGHLLIRSIGNNFLSTEIFMRF